MIIIKNRTSYELLIEKNYRMAQIVDQVNRILDIPDNDYYVIAEWDGAYRVFNCDDEPIGAIKVSNWGEKIIVSMLFTPRSPLSDDIEDAMHPYVI